MPHQSGMYTSGVRHGHAAAARLQQAVAPAWARIGGDYTLIHAGRQLRLGPIAFWIVVGTLVIMGLWTITTATYFAFRDDVLTRLITRQADMQFGYEDRIAELRAQVDRMSSRQLLDQEQFEQKLDQILRRQAQLESRAATLGTLPDGGITGSIKPPPRGETRSVPRPAPMAVPMNDSLIPAAPRERRANLGGGLEGTLARLSASLDRVEARQATTLASMGDTYDAKAKRIRNVLIELGVDAGKLAPPTDAHGVGGPFVAPKLRPDSGTFEREVHRISIARVHVERLTRTLGSVPVRKPLAGDIDPASGFGVRMDPFIKAPAMHTGLDLQAQTGDPVRVTANGKVTVAGWQGGYGKMVEIDHGNGLVTRYGHLSAIDVTIGQSVRIGQVIGKVGTTGRSTGPHLHYETRVDGEAVDPQKFLRAGMKLGTM
jgi:murein DD-endopeptidase MepM/ murein hydrolase activator NlpD